MTTIGGNAASTDSHHPTVQHCLAVTLRIPLEHWSMTFAPLEELKKTIRQRNENARGVYPDDVDPAAAALGSRRVPAIFSVQCDLRDSQKFASLMSILKGAPEGGSSGPTFHFDLNPLTGEASNVRLAAMLPGANGELQEFSGPEVVAVFRNLHQALAKPPANPAPGSYDDLTTPRPV